jgi:uncharacterized membrane protein YhaH (DUF805 family)
MNFTLSIKTCSQKYADFSGRATRSEFWFFTLFVQLLFLCSAVLDPYVAGVEPDDYLEIYGPVSMIIQIITLLPSLSVTARRLHDSGMTGWWMFVGLTGIGLIPLIYWLCRPSDGESNDFGDSPVDTFGRGVTIPASALIRFVFVPIGILIIALSAASLFFYDYVMDRGEMGIRVYSGDELSEDHLSSLQSAQLIKLTDEIQYFYSDELGTVNKSGQFVTNDRVVSFVTDDDGDLVVFEMLLKEIDRVEVVRSADEWNDGEYKIFGNEIAENEFVTVFLPSYDGGERKFLGVLGVEIN